jgi:hypothetical protein
MKSKALKITLFLSLIIFTVSFIINIYIYQNKNEGYVYVLSNYNSIYYPEELPAIVKFENTLSDNVSIILSSSNEETEWRVSNGDSTYTIMKDFPEVYLPNNGNTYESNFEICRIKDNFCFELNLQRQNLGDIQVITSSIPFINVDRYPFSDFCDISWINSSEREFVKSILKDQLQIDTCSNTLSKIELITSHINSIANRDTNIGLNNVWNAYTACEIYKYAVEGKTNLTCNEYSEVYYLFANEAQIYTRRVGVVGLGNSDGIVKISGHHFNESFVPEQGKWAFVDITSSKSYVLNKHLTVLNTFDILMTNVMGNVESLQTIALTGDSVVSLPYNETRSNEQYYFDSDCIIQYKYGDDRFNKVNQFNRYFFSPEPVLSLNYSNEKIVIKNIWFVICLLSLVSTVNMGIILWLKKRKNTLAK